MSKENVLTALKILLVIQETVAEDWPNPAVSIDVPLDSLPFIQANVWLVAVAVGHGFKPLLT